MAKSKSDVLKEEFQNKEKTNQELCFVSEKFSEAMVLINILGWTQITKGVMYM